MQMEKTDLLQYRGTVLYFHDFMTNEEETQEEVRRFQRLFYDNGLRIDEVRATDNPPFIGASGERGYDLLLFDWGGASMGNDMMRHFCRKILDEAIECPSRIYVMVSTFTKEAMQEVRDSFRKANNGSVPPNVFLTIPDAASFFLEMEVHKARIDQKMRVLRDAMIGEGATVVVFGQETKVTGIGELGGNKIAYVEPPVVVPTVEYTRDYVLFEEVTNIWYDQTK